MSRVRYSVVTLFILLLIATACGVPASSATAPAATSTSAPLTAMLSELSGSVEARQPSEADFTPASAGQTLQPGGEIHTGDDGRTRLDLSDGTILRIGPSSAFMLKQIEASADGPNTSVKVDGGKLWILLKSGGASVETPSGVASVRGSYLSVDSRPDGSVRITCLEGNCGLDTDAGGVDLVAGQAAFVTAPNQIPQTGQMTPDDFSEWLTVNPEASVILPAVTATQQALPPQATPTPQPTATPVSLGPNLDNFPANYNPLTGQPVNDVSTLKLPALLISVSNFPVTARPQAGLSFADYVFEIYITEGATRFLSAFYGDFPFPEVPFMGGCEVRMQPFVATGLPLGNQIWLDKNANGVQDYGEPGVGGVCVNLYDSSGALISQTTTDSNGYYGFNVSAGTYSVEVVKPTGMQFTQANVGDESHDSDVDQLTGRMEAEVDSPLLNLDAGLVPPVGVTPTPDPSSKQADPEVGPVRSGRLIYADIAGFFQDSCLVYAFASEEVLDKIPQCAMVAHQDAGGGSMLDLTRMREIADKNEKANTVFNYASNMYTDVPPAGGFEASQIDVFFALLNQSGWKYDPLMQSYLRYTDNADKDTAGQLHPDTDRLNGRQLHFENVIILFTDHDVISPTNLDIHLEQGGEGPAMLFRDGKEYDIRWSTRSGQYEKDSGLRRPIQWVDRAGNPVPLKPGHTWVIVVTPFSTVLDQGAGVWRVRFYAPAGAQ